MLLMEMRDKKFKDAMIKTVHAGKNYSAQEIYALVDRELILIARDDMQDFTKASEPSHLIMDVATGAYENRQTLVLGNSYNFGGWMTALAVVRSFVLGYMVGDCKGGSSQSDRK